MGDGPESCGGRAALTGPSAATVRPSMVGVGAQREAVPGHVHGALVPTEGAHGSEQGGPENGWWTGVQL